MKILITLIYLFSFVLLICIILIIGKINLFFKFKNQVKDLFRNSIKVTNQKFDKSQLEGLPEPVKKYFLYALREGQSYINYVRIKHSGQFKTGFGNKWVNIMGEQYVTTQIPGFIWKGTTSIFAARDIYISGKGRLIVSLLSMINTVDAMGDQYNQGELLRWLGESVLYPTTLLPSENLKWQLMDGNMAKLIFNYNELQLFFDVTFNEQGEITQMESMRYIDQVKIEKWVIKLSDYKEFQNIKIPTSTEVLWKLEKGDFSYARFNITKVEYEKPELF